MSRFVVARIGKTFGISGTFRARIVTDFPAHLEELKQLYISGIKKPFEVEKVRVKGKFAFVKLEGINSPEEARKYSGSFLEITEDMLAPLKEGEFYFQEVEGLEVQSSDGNFLGTVLSVERIHDEDYFAVLHNGKEFLIPLYRLFISEFDLEKRKMRLSPLAEGLLEL